jgi:hypothetical protein
MTNLNNLLLLDIQLNKKFDYWLIKIVLFLLGGSFFAIPSYIFFEGGCSLSSIVQSSIVYIFCGCWIPLYLLRFFPSTLIIKIYNHKLSINSIDYELKNIQAEFPTFGRRFVKIKYYDRIVCKLFPDSFPWGLVTANGQTVNGLDVYKIINQLKNGSVFTKPIEYSNFNIETISSHKIIWFAVVMWVLPWLLIIYIIK